MASDPQAPALLVDGVKFLVTAGVAGGGVKWYETWKRNRREDKVEPTIAVAAAAEQVAASAAATVESLLVPLRAEIAEVREELQATKAELTQTRVENADLKEEVHLLRQALTAAKLPIPTRPTIRRIQ